MRRVLAIAALTAIAAAPAALAAARRGHGDFAVAQALLGAMGNVLLVLGALGGSAGIARPWTEPLHGRIATSLPGGADRSVEDLVTRTHRLPDRMLPRGE